MEKVLNVSSHLSHKDLSVRFGCLEAEGLAEEILDRCIFIISGFISTYTAFPLITIDTSAMLKDSTLLLRRMQLTSPRLSFLLFPSTAHASKINI